jgi:hypothetical protein
MAAVSPEQSAADVEPGQRVQAADQQALHSILMDPDAASWYPRAWRSLPMVRACGWRGAGWREARGLVTCTEQWRIRARSGPHDNHR